MDQHRQALADCRDESLREIYHDQYEGDPHKEQPDKWQVAPEQRRDVVDSHRAEDRANKGPAPTQGGPNDKFGSEDEIPI